MFRYRKNLPLDIQHDMARNIKIITSIKISSLIYWMIERKNSKWTIFRREKCSQTLYRQFYSECGRFTFGEQEKCIFGNTARNGTKYKDNYINQNLVPHLLDDRKEEFKMDDISKRKM